MIKQQSRRSRSIVPVGNGWKHFFKPMTMLLGVCLSFFFADCAFASDQIQILGDELQLILPAVAFGVTALHQDGAGALQFLEAGSTTVGITYGLKTAFPDTRPNGGPDSFPSGHTSISFSSAEFLRKRYGLEYGLPAYALATFVGYSRYECKAHAIDDIIVGAGIGVISSYLFTTPYEGWNVQVGGDRNSIAVNFLRSW